MTKVSLDTTNSVSIVPANTGYSGPISILPLLELVPQLEPFKTAATNVEAQASRAVISSEEAYQKGSDFLTVCADQWQQLEDLRKAVKNPIDDYAKLIQSIFVPLQRRFEAAKSSVNAKMLAFHKAEEARRKAEEDKQRRINEEAAQRLAEEAAQRGDHAVADAILDVATQAPVMTSRPRIGGTNSFGRSTAVTKRWTASVDKPMEVLQAIIDGKLPISLIDWKQVELNKVATTLKVEKTVMGLKVFQSESLQQR
jgi:hypothetical protein